MTMRRSLRTRGSEANISTAFRGGVEDGGVLV
jgi:hypothetical protein